MNGRKWKYLLGWAALLGIVLAGCSGAGEPTSTPAVPTLIVPTPPTAAETATETTTAASTPAEGPATAEAVACTLTANSEITLYQRPSTEAGVFGFLAAGDLIEATMQAEGGWLGFVPAVAQAANVGVFRFRWLPPEADVTAGGDCAALPSAPPLSPTACYFMAFEATALRTEPDPAAPEAATIPAEGYAAVIGQADNGWYELELADSSLAQSGTGWLEPSLGNFNGTCDLVGATP